LLLFAFKSFVMIILTYQITDIINNAQILSALRANAVLPGKEEILDAQLTNDDEALMIKYLKQGSAEIIGKLSGYTDNLYDVDLTLKEPLEITVSTITIRLNADAIQSFRTTVVPSLDKSIEDALESYSIYRINEFKGHSFETFLNNYDKACSKMLSYINARTQPVTRRYNLL